MGHTSFVGNLVFWVDGLIFEGQLCAIDEDYVKSFCLFPTIIQMIFSVN